MRPSVGDGLRDHLSATRTVVDQVDDQLATIMRWAGVLAESLTCGRRILVAGNGGSATHAQHLTSELVGRFQRDRRPYDAVSLTADSSALTAIANDYGYDQVFARQVDGLGRAGDVLVCLSTSGASPSVVKAAHAGRAAGLRTWALTGPMPNPLGEASDEVIALDPGSAAAVQEGHHLVVHLMCSAFDALCAGER